MLSKPSLYSFKSLLVAGAAAKLVLSKRAVEKAEPRGRLSSVKALTASVFVLALSLATEIEVSPVSLSLVKVTEDLLPASPDWTFSELASPDCTSSVLTAFASPEAELLLLTASFALAFASALASDCF